MKKLFVVVIALLFIGCAGQFQNINGYENVRKHSEKWCRIGCISNIEKNSKDIYYKVRKCSDSCLELSYADKHNRIKKDKCGCCARLK